MTKRNTNKFMYFTGIMKINCLQIVNVYYLYILKKIYKRIKSEVLVILGVVKPYLTTI